MFLSLKRFDGFSRRLFQLFRLVQPLQSFSGSATSLLLGYRSCGYRRARRSRISKMPIPTSMASVKISGLLPPVASDASTGPGQ